MGEWMYISTFSWPQGKWSASRLGRFTPRERAPQYPLDRRLGGPQSQSGRRGEEKILDPTRIQTLISSVVQPRASRYTNYVILVPLPNHVTTKKFFNKLSQLNGQKKTVFHHFSSIPCGHRNTFPHLISLPRGQKNILSPLLSTMWSLKQFLISGPQKRFTSHLFTTKP
jgi:hypothetical protein